MAKMLEFNPAVRITSTEILNHKFFNPPEEEPEMPIPSSPVSIKSDNRSFHLPQLSPNGSRVRSPSEMSLPPLPSYIASNPSLIATSPLPRSPLPFGFIDIPPSIPLPTKLETIPENKVPKWMKTSRDILPPLDSIRSSAEFKANYEEEQQRISSIIEEMLKKQKVQSRSRSNEQVGFSKNSKTEPEIKSKWDIETDAKKKGSVYSEFK